MCCVKNIHIGRDSTKKGTCSLGDDLNSLVFLAAMAGDMTLDVICLYLSSCSLCILCTNSAEYVNNASVLCLK